MRCACSVTSVMSNSLRSHGLQPARLLYPRGLSRQEYWRGLPCPPPGDLPDPGIKPVSLMSPELAGEFFITSTTWVVCESGWTAVKAVDKIPLNNYQLMAYFTKINFKLVFILVSYNVLLFCCKAKWLGYTYMHIPSSGYFFSIFRP